MTTKNFDEIAYVSEGLSFKDAEGKDGTFKHFIVQALSARLVGDDRLSMQDAYKRGKLADKIDAGGDIDLAADEMTMIKDCVAKAWPPRLVARIHDKVDADYNGERRIV